MDREPTDLMEVLVGTNDLRSNGMRYKVKNYILHQNYSALYKQNDIAVAKIEGKFEFNDRVQPIEFSPEEVPDESVVQFTG